MECKLIFFFNEFSLLGLKKDKNGTKSSLIEHTVNGHVPYETPSSRFVMIILEYGWRSGSRMNIYLHGGRAGKSAI